MEERTNFTKEEIETIINYTNADTYAEAYTNNTVIMKKYLKLAESNPKEVVVVQSDINSVCIRFPKKWVKIKPPRIMSEEQKQAAAERLRQLRSSGKLSKEDFLEDDDMEFWEDEEIIGDEDFL